MAEAQTLIEVLKLGEGSRAAIVSPDGPTLTYDGLRRQVGRLMAQLRGFGLTRTDRVAIVLPNGIEVIASFLAVSGVATAAPLNAAYKPEEFEFYLDDTGAKAIITGPKEGLEAVEAAGEDVLHIAITMDSTGGMNFIGPPRGDGGAGTAPKPSDVALILHTSGTTSRPKRVPLTHGNLTSSLRNVAATYDLGPDDVSLCIMPLFHVHGLVASTLATFQSGGTVVVPPKFNPLNFWPVVKDHGVTWYSAVPSMHQALLTRAKSRGAGDPPPGAETLRFIRSCSAALAPSLMHDLEEAFGAPVLEAYGMTEAAHQMASNPLPPADRKAGSVGPGTGVEVAIMDVDGSVLKQGAKGEVVIKGANVITGYEDNPEANASSFTDGWFRTGDEGVIDDAGYLTLTGRLKEIINRSGEKISPREIDEVLGDHPAVAEAVAFGVPHPTHGEEPAAVVVLSGEATAAELVAYCRTRLADFKVPRTIHIVDQIPRGATGKIQRRFVAEAFSGQGAAS
ncbi:MAG: AMP-binding protein [Chloroflexi bacterium]|nr:AMP-binding protein [Chloroflexota bacterium]